MDVVHVQLIATRALALMAAALLLAGCASVSAHRPGAPLAPPTSTSSTASPAVSSTPPGLARFAAVDLSFVSADDGWALGTADCLSGRGRCPAMLHTADGGRTWHATTPPPAHMYIVTGDGCADPCITHIRFATSLIGYAFGPSALYLTTDGGHTWMRQGGYADALETLNGNVIRVITSPPCGPPGCIYAVHTAAIGSTRWHTVEMRGGFTTIHMSTDVMLVRTGHTAGLMVLGHAAGGAVDATSVVYTSSDDGVQWTRRGEPCPQIGADPAGIEVDSTVMASAADGSMTLLCTPRQAQAGEFTVTSTDAGATFRSARFRFGASITAFGVASGSVILASSDHTYRSTDGGATFHRLGANAGSSPGQLTWIGFESNTIGHAISSDGRTIWTTRDAGATWTSYTFS